MSKDVAVLYRKEGSIGEIALNRPHNRNAMNGETLAAFGKIIDSVKQDRELRCLVITGSGNTFCSGADFRSDILDKGKLLPQEATFDIYRPFLAILEVEVPVIAAMIGHAVGGGLGLALICDIRVANREARYAANFVKLGLHSGMAISYMLPRVVGLPRAAEMLFTGRMVTGAQAAEIGLANYAVAPEEVLDKAWELAREIAACAPAAVRMIKRSLYRHVNWDPRPAGEYEAHCQSRTIEMEDSKEGVRALLEKREPRFRGV